MREDYSAGICMTDGDYVPNVSYEYLPATEMLASHCMYCGRELLQPHSIEQGCGDICADKYGVFAPADGRLDEASLRAALDMAPAPLREAVEKALEDSDRETAMKKINHVAGYRWEQQTDDWAAYMGSAIELSEALGFPRVSEKLRARFVEGRDRKSGGPSRGLLVESLPNGNWSLHPPRVANYDTWKNMSNGLKNAGATEERVGRGRAYEFAPDAWLSVLNALVPAFGGALGLLPTGEPFVVPTTQVAVPAPETPPAPEPDEATGEEMAQPTIQKGDQVTLADGRTLYVGWVANDGSRIGVRPHPSRGRMEAFLGTEEVTLVAPTADEVEEASAIAESRVSPRELPEKLFEHQKEAVLWLDQKRSGLVAYDMGTGKTALAAVALDAPAVVVCPAVLRANWAKELNQWRPDLSVSIVQGTATEEQLRADVVVINYDVLSRNEKALAKRGNKTIVYDEATALKNLTVRWDREKGRDMPKGPKRAQAGYRLAMAAKRRFLLSGTPIMNRTCELWPLLHLVDPDEWDNFFKFGHRYCGPKEVSIGRGRTAWEFKGASNTAELHDRIIGRYMIRKMKDEVLDLPPKTRETVPVSMDKKTAREYEYAAKQFIAWVMEQGGPEAAWRAGRAKALAQMNALRRLTAIGKVEAAVQWIAQFRESAQRPLIVFAHHREVFESVTAALTEMGMAVGQIIGGMSESARQDVIARFQDGVPASSPPEAREYLDVIVCSIQAAQFGLTLTRAQDELFIERAWRPADLAQAEDRAYRIGQRNALTVTYLDAQGTFDERMAELLLNKVETFEGVINGRDLNEGDAQQVVFGKLFEATGGAQRKNPAEYAPTSWTEPLELDD